MVEPAVPPEEPRGPGLLVLSAVAALAGLAVGTFIASLVENLDDRLHYLDEIAAVAGSPVLAAVPRSPSSAASQGPPGRAYRRLRAWLMTQAGRRRVKVVLVCGVERRCGSSTVVANLARSLGIVGRKVLVIDCAGSLHEQARLLGLQASAGAEGAWGASSADGRAPLATKAEKVDLVAAPLRVALEALPEHAASYDHVLIDASAVSSSDDPLTLAAAADVTLLVVRQGRTTAGDLADARDQLASVEGGPVGVVVTGARPGSRSDAATHAHAWGSEATGTAWKTQLATSMREVAVEAPPLA